MIVLYFTIMSKFSIFGIRIIYILSFFYFLSTIFKLKFKGVLPLILLFFPQGILLIVCYLHDINNIHYPHSTSIKLSFVIWTIVSLVGYYLGSRDKSFKFLRFILILILLGIFFEVIHLHKFFKSAGVNERMFVIITIISLYTHYNKSKNFLNALVLFMLLLCFFLNARFSFAMCIIILLYNNFPKLFTNKIYFIAISFLIFIFYYSALTLSTSHTDKIRLLFSFNGIMSFIQNPFLGTGFSNVNIVNNHTLSTIDYHKNFPNWYPNCHNNYIQLLSDFGLLSIFAFLPLLCIFISKKDFFLPLYIILVYSISISCYVIPIFWLVYGISISHYYPTRKFSYYIIL